MYIARILFAVATILSGHLHADMMRKHQYKKINFEKIVNAVQNNNRNRVSRYLPAIKRLDETQRAHLRHINAQILQQHENKIAEPQTTTFKSIAVPAGLLLLTGLPAFCFAGGGLTLIGMGTYSVFIGASAIYIFGIAAVGIGALAPLFFMGSLAIGVGVILCLISKTFFEQLSNVWRATFYPAPKDSYAIAQEIQAMLLALEER